VGFVGEGPSPVGYPLSFVDEPTFGGPLAGQIRASQAGEQAALKSRADWEQEVMDEATRARLMIEEEVAAENFSAQTLREAERIKMLSPFQQEAQLSSLREELRVRREDEMTTLRDPEYRRLTLKMAENLAKMQALVTDRPQFFDRLDPDTGDVSTTMLYRDPTTGFMKFQSMTGVFPGVPWNAYQAGELSDPVAQLVRTMSQEGWDVTTPEGASEFTRKASALQIPPDQAGAALDNIQQVISGGETLPPVPTEESEEKFFGPGVAGDQPVALPYSEYERVLGDPATDIVQTPQVGPNQRGLTVDWGRILGGTSPRDINEFLGQEGPGGQSVLDWLTSQTASDPRITADVIRAMLRTPEGLQLLRDAWAQQ